MAFPLLKLIVLRTHRLEEMKAFYETLGIKFVEEIAPNSVAHDACVRGLHTDHQMPMKGDFVCAEL